MRVGIYGGTFDPIHNGHLIIATSMLENLRLDKLVIMPAYIPPHKEGIVNADFNKRFEWAKKAFNGMDKIEISDFEGRKKNISYTFDTVRHFKKCYAKILYVIGEDSFIDIEKWYKYKELIEEVELWVYPRYCEKKYLAPLLKRLGKLSANVHFLEDFPLIQISSTLIRDRIKKGLTIKGYVPEGIEREIVEFYGNVKKS